MHTLSEDVTLTEVVTLDVSNVLKARLGQSVIFICLTIAWTYTPTRFSNQYFKLLTTVDWRKKKWDGPLQYVDEDDELMMLPADMAVIWDPEFAKVAKEYAKDQEVFFKDFAAAFGKLLELGVPRGGKSCCC